MLHATIIELIEQKVKTVEAHGFGEVTVKIKNGAVYRILATTDTIMEKCPDPMNREGFDKHNE